VIDNDASNCHGTTSLSSLGGGAGRVTASSHIAKIPGCRFGHFAQYDQVGRIGRGDGDYGARLMLAEEYVVRRLGEDAGEAVEVGLEGAGRLAGRRDFRYCCHHSAPHLRGWNRGLTAELCQG